MVLRRGNGADLKYHWGTPLNSGPCYIQHGLTGVRCWEETRPDLGGAKPVKGERGGGRASWRNRTRHSVVQSGRRGRKTARRRKRRKEDATQSRVRSLRGGREGELCMRKPAMFLEERGLFRYEDGQGKEV
ncbi:hypothetical protein NDU88_002865 [Pleurodeles waltl]|uniref:Uncharacterized protein n=1 Tax=Pleurodeles waltl TaxID=8319 RepID=A0AAV7TLV3_PLEWA|nr:hypothetical protein NDU88_002865 [Pleurodeles waltl]